MVILEFEEVLASAYNEKPRKGVESGASQIRGR